LFHDRRNTKRVARFFDLRIPFCLSLKVYGSDFRFLVFSFTTDETREGLPAPSIFDFLLSLSDGLWSDFRLLFFSRPAKHEKNRLLFRSFASSLSLSDGLWSDLHLLAFSSRPTKHEKSCLLLRSLTSSCLSLMVYGQTFIFLFFFFRFTKHEKREIKRTNIPQLKLSVRDSGFKVRTRKENKKNAIFDFFLSLSDGLWSDFRLLLLAFTTNETREKSPATSIFDFLSVSLSDGLWSDFRLLVFSLRPTKHEKSCLLFRSLIFPCLSLMVYGQTFAFLLFFFDLRNTRKEK